MQNNRQNENFFCPFEAMENKSPRNSPFEGTGRAV